DDRTGEAHDVGDVAATDQLRTRNDAADHARAKHERVCALARHGPEADAAVAGMLDQEIALERRVRRIGLLVGREQPHLARMRSLQRRNRDEDAVAVALIALRL